jgi:alpha-L-rhamnosidase
MKTNSVIFILAALCLFFQQSIAQKTSIDVTDTGHVRSTQLVRKYLTPTRIVWMSDTTGATIQNAELLLKAGSGQAILNKNKGFQLISSATEMPMVILDFGKEIQGGLELVTTINNAPKMPRLRIRFGESVSETMSNIDENGATNDHAMRDFTIQLPWLGSLEVGNSGFRFVSIQLVEPDSKIELQEISAVSVLRDIPYLGTFKCNDERLNQIWMTGAYTVHLNMQDYLWDGIKRDRLVWVGDLHPEVMTVNTVFGYNEVVPKSLDLIRDLTPLPAWMNGMASYSLWWVIIHDDWYRYQGDLGYLKQQKSYLFDLLRLLATKIDESGKEILAEGRFLDWPSHGNPKAIQAGLQSLMVMTFQSGAVLCEVLGDKPMVEFCNETVQKLKKYVPEPANSKQAAALLALSGLVPAGQSNAEILSKDGVQNMSTFYGYYMLKARAMAGDYQGALDNIREYWGGMLDLGATSFWEHFEIDWLKNANRIDEVVAEGKVDVHAAYGDHCYKGFRHSFCHGWASGPTSWLSEYVLGVRVLEPGCKKVKIEPHLGDLEWVEGTFPTPYGVIRIRHDKQKNGKIVSKISAPKGVKIIR